MEMDEKISFDLEIELPLINSKLKNIDEFISYWNEWQLEKPKQVLKELKELSTIQSIGSSTRIEGSELTDEEVKELINDLQINKMQTRDQQEVLGYYEVLKIISETYNGIYLTESYIKQLHNILLKHSDKDTRHKGVYKSLSNKVVAKYPGGVSRVIFNTTEPYLVETEMQTLIEWTNKAFSESRTHPLIVIAAFVYEFLSIHPFQDGNGRLSRLLTTLLMLQNDYYFVEYISFEHVIEQRKKEYYQNLMECQKHRYSNEEKIAKWIIFFLDCIENLIIKLQIKLDTSKKLSQSGNSSKTRHRKILDCISSNQAQSISEIYTSLDKTINKETLKKDLSYLVKENLIQQKGRGRGTFYTL